MDAFTDGYAYDDYSCLYLLSVAGRDSNVKAITSALVSGRAVDILSDETIRSLRVGPEVPHAKREAGGYNPEIHRGIGRQAGALGKPISPNVEAIEAWGPFELGNRGVLGLRLRPAARGDRAARIPARTIGVWEDDCGHEAVPRSDTRRSIDSATTAPDDLRHKGGLRHPRRRVP